MKKITDIFEDNYLREDLSIVAKEIDKFKELRNSVVLITGATGLIGVSLARVLLWNNEINDSNNKIIILVRNKLKAKDIYGELLEDANLKILISDIVEKVVIEENIDYIFHCASITESKMMISNPVETIVTSVYGTRNILDLAVEKKVKSFVYVSSMEMYGYFGTEGCIVDELNLGYINPLIVRNNYPESKRLCENMCVAYLSEYHVPVKIARLAQSFGAGIIKGENRVFAQFARSVINNNDIVLHTKGESEGNYCYLADAILGLFYILMWGEKGEAYNVSNPKTHMTISEMAKMVSSDIALNRIKVVYDIDDNNSNGYAVDTKMSLNSDKLQALGWRPRVGLKEAYERLIGSMRNGE